jgi:DNA polymerase sigma
LHNEILLFK